MPPKQRHVFSRGVASPATYGTALMRITLAVTIVLSAVASMLYAVALGTDQVYQLHNNQNIYYTPVDDAAGSKEVLLLPQFEATVGLVTACVSHSCFARGTRSRVIGLMAGTLGNQYFTDSELAKLQKQLEFEFNFGYDSGVHCGVLPTKLQKVFKFGYAAYTISLVFFIGAFICSLLFCQLLGDTDMLAGTLTLNEKCDDINVDDLDLPGKQVVLKLKQHLRREGPLLISLLAFTGAALVFSVCGMGVTIAAESSSSKCGVSVCTSFKTSMKSFFGELVRRNIAVSDPRIFSCSTGASFPLSIVGFVLGLLCFSLACLLFGWFTCSQRRSDTFNLRDQLFRSADVQEQLGILTGADTAAVPLVQSLQNSSEADAGSLELSYGDCSGGVRKGIAKTNPTVLSTAAYASYPAGSVGERIGYYRVLKEFMSTEVQARHEVMAQERLAFFSVLAMKEALWCNEELCMLHEFTLSWFAGPLLDLCVLETNERQRIMAEFITFECDFLKSVSSGIDNCKEPTQAWTSGGPLSAADSVQWSQQAVYWQRVQAEMAPRILQSASYTRVVAPQKQQRKAPSAHTLLPASTLDTDQWIAVLEKLRVSTHDDGAFITRSASSPLLSRRNTSSAGAFETETSFSFNVFSSPSFTLRCGYDFIPPDNVRAHLVKMLPRPPPRLRTLPQFAEKKRTSSGKSGKVRRRRSGSSCSRSGRVSSSQDGSLVVTHVGAGNVWSSSLNGRSSGRSLSQPGFAVLKAYVASSSSYQAGLTDNKRDTCANDATDPKAQTGEASFQTPSFPLRNSLHFAKPTA